MKKKTLNKQELRRKIEARRAQLAREKRLEEAKARAAARKTVTETRTRPAVRPAVRPVVERQVARQRPVIKETTLSNRFKKRNETIKENISRRNKEYNIPEGQHKVYTMLAENIAGYANARKSLLENFNAAGQAKGSYGAQGVNLVGSVHTFFDIFYGFFPQLIAPQIASVQPMKTEQGFLFYMQFVAGSDKGSVTKGEVFMDPFQVASQDEYTSNTATIGSIKKTGATDVSTALWAPFKNLYMDGELVELNDSNKATVDTNKTLTVSFENGGTEVKVALSAAPSKELSFTYEYDNVYVPTEVPLLAPNIVRIPISAKYRTIKTNHAFQAAYGFEAEHGAKLGEKLADAAMEQLKREIDLDVLFKAFNAANQKVVWNKAAGVAVGGYQEHKLSLRDAFAGAANLILKGSKRVRGNVLVVGVDVLTIVETLPGFTGVELGEQLPGAAVVGKLGKLPVIVSPDVKATEWLMLYKGPKENFDAGIVFAPYLPVFATEPAILDDFVVRQAFITAYATKVVNPNYFVKGEIINNPVALPIYLVNKNGESAGEDLDFGDIGDSTLDIFEDPNA